MKKILVLPLLLITCSLFAQHKYVITARSFSPLDSSITSGNGVTISGGQANLGALTGNVNIDGTFDYQEGASTPLGNREIYASAIKLQAAGGASQFDMDGGGMSISGDVYAPGTGTLTDTSGYFPVLMNRSNGKFKKLPWSLLPSGGGGGLDSAGVRSIVSDSVKTMVSGEGIVFDELSPDSIKVSVDTAWLSAKIDSALARGPKIWIGLVSQTGTDDPTAIVLENTTGDTLRFQYLGGGKYKAYFDTFTFGANKVWGISSPANSGSPGVPVYSVILKQQGSDYIQISVGTADDTGLDGQLYNTPIEIKFYQ